MNDGFTNETELRDYINNNSWATYNQNMRNLLEFSFGTNLDKSKKFTAEKCEGQVKPDLVISHNNKKTYISIKKGSGNSVHQENISVFFPYIEELLGREALNNLRLFHYGDDTLDDTGKTRYSAIECQNKYKNEVANLNKLINEWKYLNQFLDRFLFLGNVSSTLITDIIYHGNISSGIWASRDELLNYFKNNSFTSSALHFASLTYQVWGRNNSFTAVYPDRRYVMQVKWGGILNDLNAIKKVRDNE
ncbi:MAG: hypothetical protein RBT59_13025 [Arcobacteraceae bacterium]|jgi:hypothetical protein|nr:hypothetical protein [Arcobacteraceae bacterium]